MKLLALSPITLITTREATW